MGFIAPRFSFVTCAFRDAVKTQFIFMDDCTTSHRTSAVTSDIRRIKWPANSPDLNNMKVYLNERMNKSINAMN